MKTEFDEIVTLIMQTKSQTYSLINRALVKLYWNVGKHIYWKTKNADWGKQTIKELAAYITKKEPTLKGFSARGLWRMRQFYGEYHADEKLSPLVTQISWTNNLLILSKTKTFEEKEFYIKNSMTYLRIHKAKCFFRYLLLSLFFIFCSSTSMAQTVTAQAVFSSPILYFKLNNQVRLFLPRKVNPKKITLSAQGSKILSFDRESCMVELQPITGYTTLNILYKKDTLDKLDFNVELLPRPEVRLFVDDGICRYSHTGFEIKKGEKGVYLDARPRRLRINFILDKMIKSRFKNQTKYSARGWRLSLACNRELILQKEFSKNEINEEDLKSFFGNWEAGNRLVIEVYHVVRTDFEGKRERLNIGRSIFTMNY